VTLKHTLLWRWPNRVTDKAIDALDEKLHFAIYVRVVIEMYLFAALSSFSEAEAFRRDSAASLSSLVCSFLLSVLALVLCLLVSVHYWMYRRLGLETLGKRFNELYADLRDRPLSRLYTSMFLL
jgi:hypothetical protein